MAVNVIITGTLSFNTIEETQNALKKVDELNKQQLTNPPKNKGQNVLTTNHIKPFEGPTMLSVDFEGSIPASYWTVTIDFLQELLKDAVYYCEVNCYFEQEPVLVLKGQQPEKYKSKIIK